eukprot:2546049-Rhodomonas_salina.1
MCIRDSFLHSPFPSLIPRSPAAKRRRQTESLCSLSVPRCARALSQYPHVRHLSTVQRCLSTVQRGRSGAISVRATPGPVLRHVIEVCAMYGTEKRYRAMQAPGLRCAIPLA